MPSPHTDLTDFISRLERDIARATGDAHGQLVRDTALRIARLGIAGATDKIVEDVQQALHDEAIDITWPACPRHHRHPLWYRDGAWWCEEDGVAITTLGELPVATEG